MLFLTVISFYIMRRRNEQGMFIRKSENTDMNNTIVINLPNLSTLVKILLIIFVLLPWMVITYKADFASKLVNLFNYWFIETSDFKSSSSNGAKEQETSYWSK